MIVIAGGNAVIGAPDSDLAALPAERPQRSVKIWPGFTISRSPILQNELEAFQTETGLAVHTCQGAAPQPPRDRPKPAVCT